MRIMNIGRLMIRNIPLILLILCNFVQMQTGIIEDVVYYELPYLDKVMYLFGEEHTDDSLDPVAIAQRDEITGCFEDIVKAHSGVISCYLESNEESRVVTMQQPYSYLRDALDYGDFFEQFYIALAYADGQDVMHRNLQLSTFDIRDAVYCVYEALLINEQIHDINWPEMCIWLQNIDNELHVLLSKLQSHYPKKFITHLTRDMNHKKKRVVKTVTQCMKTRRARYYERALNDFYDYTDLLADFTILHKLATDSNEVVIIHAGTAHVETLTRYLDFLPA